MIDTFIWRASTIVGLAAICGAAMAGMGTGVRASNSTTRALRQAYEVRQNQKGCEPMAPIQTILTAPQSGMVGSPIDLKFDAVLTEFGARADFRVDVPQGISLVSGKAKDSGTMAANHPTSWNLSVVVDRPGDYEVNIQLIAGEENYRFGQRRTLFVHASGSTLELKTEKPKVQPVLQQDPFPAQIVKESVFPNVRNVGAPPPVEPFNKKFDPFGAELDPNPNQSLTDATVTVNGTWRYRHTDATLHAGYGTTVEAWDDDTTTADDLLDVAVVDGAGNYTLSFDNADDVGFGTADVYLVFRSENSRIIVHNTGTTDGYLTSTSVIWSNILGGTFTAPSYFADWGTNGISDNNERSFQVCDDATTAWQHWRYYTGVLFDNRLTYIQWYIGSVDGSYYLTAENRIYFEDSDVSSPDVLMHEYGHSMHDGLFSDVQWPPGTGGPHSFTGHYTTGLAWTEGFGTYYSCTAQGNDWIYNSYDPGNLITFDCDANYDGNLPANGNSDGLSTGGNTGYDTESAVLSFQLDIDDSRNSTTDPYDWMTAGDDEIFDVMRNYTTGGHRPYSVQEFFDGWHANVDFQNPKINGLMHNHGMPQPINFPTLGVSNGVDGWAGTWYYGGYGRGSFDVMNYSSRNYNLNRLYVWLRGPGGEDVGQFGSDGDNTPIPSGGTRNIWKTADQTGYNPAAPNFVLGNYTITAGHYRSDNVYQTLQVSETGATNQITKNVVLDTSGPSSIAVQDDGANQTSLIAIHITAQSNDPESSIGGYWTRVGSSAGAGNYQDWVLHPANNVTNWDYTITGLAIPNGATAFVTVVSQNINSNDSSFAYSDGIKCGDTTAPGPVTVTDDGLFAPRNDQLHYVTSTTEPDGGIYLWWSRVGTTSGAGDVQDWVSYPIHTTTFNNTIIGLTMPTGKLYYITSVARNYGIMDTYGYSNGILSPLFVTTATVQAGLSLGSGVGSLQYSENTRFLVLCDEFDSNGTVQVSATSPVLSGSAIYVLVETNASRSDQVQFTELYNNQTSSWLGIDTRAATISDSAYTVTLGTPSRFINQVTGQTLGRIRWIPFQDMVSADGWVDAIDRFNWYIAP